VIGILTVFLKNQHTAFYENICQIQKCTLDWCCKSRQY